VDRFFRAFVHVDRSFGRAGIIRWIILFSLGHSFRGSHSLGHSLVPLVGSHSLDSAFRWLFVGVIVLLSLFCLLGDSK
jgi:hypothetical protein